MIHPDRFLDWMGTGIAPLLAFINRALSFEIYANVMVLDTNIHAQQAKADA
jgi:hypothetical protein